jgi:hypothetical protein
VKIGNDQNVQWYHLLPILGMILLFIRNGNLTNKEDTILTVYHVGICFIVGLYLIINTLINLL